MTKNTNSKQLNKITPQDIADELRTKCPELSFSQALAIVEESFGNLATALICGDRVELRRFGSMVVRKRAPKEVNNPRTGQLMEIPTKGFVYYRPSKWLLSILNSEEKPEQQA